MKRNQANRGEPRRLMYVENRSGEIDGHRARIGWVTFSKSGPTIYYRGRSLTRSKEQGGLGNYVDTATGEEYWVSGLKRRGSNVHPKERRLAVHVDDDAREEHQRPANA